jgi:hypothetical protein
MDYEKLIERFKKPCWGESAHLVDKERMEAATALSTEGVGMKEYIERAVAEQAIHAIMPSMSTPDGAGANDEMVFAAQEMCVDALSAVHCLPAADVAEVRHGRWKFLGPNRLIKSCMCGTCSVCHVRSKFISNIAICPTCGAHMDGEIKNETN